MFQSIIKAMSLAVVMACISLPSFAQDVTAGAQIDAPIAEQVSPQLVVQAGTTLMLQMDQTVSAANAAAGDLFQATLQANIHAGSELVAGPGTKVTGRVMKVQKAGRAAGTSELQIEFTYLTINGNLVPIVTQPYAIQGSSQGGKTVGRTARGAIIGGLIDGSDGAATGAAVGAGVSLLAPGEQVAIEQGKLLEVRLHAPIYMQ